MKPVAAVQCPANTFSKMTMKLTAHVFTKCLILPAVVAVLAPPSAIAAELHIGAATVDITPEQPVALSGQRRVRISKQPATPVQASLLAIEAREDGRVVDQAIFVSCDLVAIRGNVRTKTSAKIADLLDDFDSRKICVSATHTHTAPVMLDGRYALPKTGIMQPAEFVEWMTDKIANAAAEAWKNRRPGKVAWGQSQAVVAHNRRPFYAGGTARMYGPTNTPNFRGMEGYEDHSVGVLFFWDASDQLIATVVNLPCPSQEVEGGSELNADFWHPVRVRLRQAHGENLHVLAWCGASGDVVSRPAIDKRADARMRRLRGDLSRLDEVARRILTAWEDAYAGARNDVREDVAFSHRVREIDLPKRLVTDAEYDAAKREADKFRDDSAQQWNFLWNNSVVTRYEAQQAGTESPYRMKLHALRLGDVAIASNDFELYTDFGIQMKARSPAVQTFVIQLAGPGTYLPSERAASHGGYGAVIQSSVVGPKGGQVLVDETVADWNALWAK